MSTSLTYFAYGSNLHPVRLGERIPSARLITTGQLNGYRLAFHKRGQDGSGKCNLVHTGRPADHVLGAIYTINRVHKAELDIFEGNGNGYIDQQLVIDSSTGIQSCFSYMAQHTHIDDQLLPYHWYKHLVREGARFLGFHSAYIRAIDDVDSRADPHRQRDQEHQALIERLLSCPGGEPDQTD